MSVVLRGVRRSFGDVVAVDGVDLELADGALTSLVGPSGCGKTTTLRLIAGFDQPDAGEIDIHGTTVAGPGVSVPPEDRRVGVVFQHLALFPHLDVAANVGYGLRGVDRRQRAARVEELLALVDLPGIGARLPHELSGGQAQRVAVARALAASPGVVVLDEPFSSLDVGLRAELRAEIRGILRAAGVTALLVTHDQAEALSMGDQVAVMFAGRIVQFGSPEDVYAHPASVAVGAFLGDANPVPGRARGGGVDTELGLVEAEVADGDVVVLVRPEDIAVTAGSGGPAAVTDVRFTGADRLVTVRLTSGATLTARLPAHQGVAVGDAVAVSVRPGAPLVAFPAS